MAITNWLVGCSMVCSLATAFVTSAARAEPIGGVRQSEGLSAPVFGKIPMRSIPACLSSPTV